MRDPDNILAVSALRPDYMGFIFYQGSPRFVGDDFRMPNGFPSFVKRVGVFVNETVDKIIGLSVRHNLDMVQLHGSEPVDQCIALRHSGLKVIKAIGVSNGINSSLLREYEGDVDFFLFDKKGPLFGGHGKSFDWVLLNQYQSAVPFFLSGGIDPGNARNVDSVTNQMLHAVDINSGVEMGIGSKSVELISRVRNILSRDKEL